MSQNRLKSPARKPGFFLGLLLGGWRRRFFRLQSATKSSILFWQPPIGIGLRSMRVATLSTRIHPGAEQPTPQSVGAAASPSSPVVQNVLASLDEAKAEDIISIDLRGKTALADVMIIATGRSTTHVSSIADKAMKAFKAAGVATPRVEGLPQCDWVLIDAGDVIVHVFRPEVRQFYNLEKMWGGDRPVEMRLV